MPNDNQAAKSYIEAVMARADINALAAFDAVFRDDLERINET